VLNFQLGSVKLCNQHVELNSSFVIAKVLIFFLTEKVFEQLFVLKIISIFSELACSIPICKYTNNI